MKLALAILGFACVGGLLALFHWRSRRLYLCASLFVSGALFMFLQVALNPHFYLSDLLDMASLDGLAAFVVFYSVPWILFGFAPLIVGLVSTRFLRKRYYSHARNT